MSGFVTFSSVNDVSDEDFEREVEHAVNSGMNIDNLKSQSPYFHTLLHEAILANNKDRAKILIKHGASLNVTDAEGVTPLHAAVGAKLETIVRLLLDKNANVNAQDANGMTPLHLALKTESKEIVELLVKNGANPRSVNNAGESPESIAKKMGPVWITILIEFDTQQENIRKCTDNLVTNNPRIPHQKALNLCSVLNGILDSSTERDIPEKFDKILHRWFFDNSIVEEIFKTIRSEQLCFLHEIDYNKEKRSFEIIIHRGKKQKLQLHFDLTKYYRNEISTCKSKLIAIPISIKLIKERIGHATVIIIDRTGEIDQTGKENVIIEHFDSANFTNLNVQNFEADIQNLITTILGDGYNYTFIGQMEVCPDNIQGRLNGTKYHGSCTQFQMWYAFKRLLEPHKPRKQVIAEMDVFLKNGEDAMIQLIKAFQSLVSISFSDSRLSRMNDFFFHFNKFSGKVNNNRKFTHRFEYGGKKRTKRHGKLSRKLGRKLSVKLY
jgi:hypothetical protein